MTLIKILNLSSKAWTVAGDTFFFSVPSAMSMSLRREKNVIKTGVLTGL